MLVASWRARLAGQLAHADGRCQATAGHMENIITVAQAKLAGIN